MDEEVSLILSEVERLNIFKKDVDSLRIQNVILQTHNTLESLLNLCITNYYFGQEPSNKDKANHFWINILADLNFFKKISISQAAGIISKEIIDILTKINAIRNDVAHYPNRIHKRKKAHLCYNEKDIYKDSEAVKEFCSDSKKALTELSGRWGA